MTTLHPTKDITLEVLYRLILEVKDGQAKLESSQIALNTRVSEHMEGEELERREMMDDMKSFTAVIRAFVEDEEGNPDFDGHRLYHLSKIKAAATEEQKRVKDEHDAEELRMAAKKKVVDLLVNGAFIVLGFVVMGIVQSTLHAAGYLP